MSSSATLLQDVRLQACAVVVPACEMYRKFPKEFRMFFDFGMLRNRASTNLWMYMRRFSLVMWITLRITKLYNIGTRTNIKVRET